MRPRCDPAAFQITGSPVTPEADQLNDEDGQQHHINLTIEAQMKTTINVGDRVALSRQWCRDTGQLTGWAPFARGEVVTLDHSIAGIRWDGSQTSWQVNVANLVREDQLHLEEP